MRKAAAKITRAADPVRVTLFKTAPLEAGPSDGGAEMDDGEMAGAEAGDWSGVDAGGDGGELPVAGEAAGEVDDDGETAGD